MDKSTNLFLLSLACMIIVLYNFIFNRYIVSSGPGLLFIIIVCLIGGLSAGYAKSLSDKK